jgi:hypothetical protein
MKFVLSVLAAVLMAAPTSAADWVRSEVTIDQTSYVDSASLRRAGDVVRAWEKTTYPPTNPKKWKEVKSLSEFDCASRQSRVLTLTVYFTDGNNETENKVTEWKYVVPETVGESILDFVCNFNLPPAQ